MPWVVAVVLGDHAATTGDGRAKTAWLASDEWTPVVCGQKLPDDVRAVAAVLASEPLQSPAGRVSRTGGVPIFDVQGDPVAFGGRRFGRRGTEVQELVRHADLR